MAIEGFNHEEFAQMLSSQAEELVPEGFQDFQKKYVINTIKNFATLSGEAIVNDEKVKFNADQAMLITQIIAEWSFHKSVDIIKAGILPDYWDVIMQKIAFTIFEIAKQTIIKNLPQDEILQIVEHHVKKTYDNIINDLKERKIIDQVILERALNQSNIDEMMQKIQEEKMNSEEGAQGDQAAQTGQTASQSNTKVLKLASVALLLRQVSQDKVQTMLNKFNPEDAQTVIQYMQMQDLETKVDKDIALKCLREIKTNLPEPKYISPDKVFNRINDIIEKSGKDKVEKAILKERPRVKEFVTKAINGEYQELPPKVANIIVQHLEERVL